LGGEINLVMGTIDFIGLSLIEAETNEIADWLTSAIQLDAQPPLLVTHVNANNYYILCNNLRLCRHLKDNAHLLFDGIAMKLAGRLLGKGWLHDLNGTDLFPLVMKHLVNDAVPLYFLGADEFIVARAVQRTRSLWPGVRIVGYSSGYFTEVDEDRIVQSVNNSGAKVLLVARGFPLQEEFSIRQRTRLKVSLIWNVGGLFDFISGHKPRAPLWMRQTGLEWLFRLAREPRRLWHRTFVVGPWFASHIIAEHFKLTQKMLKKEVQRGWSRTVAGDS